MNLLIGSTEFVSTQEFVSQSDPVGVNVDSFEVILDSFDVSDELSDDVFDEVLASLLSLTTRISCQVTISPFSISMI